MIIGLTGKNAAGKGEVARFLEEGGYSIYSLSDVLRDELKARKKEVTREHLISIGNELRTQFGAGVLAERICKKIEPGTNTVIDSIRNPAEVAVLKHLEGFYLIAVQADPQTRFERITKRRREGDPTTYDAFVSFEAREAKSSDPLAQQLNETERLAHAAVVNDGSIEALHNNVREVIRGLAASTRRPDWDEYFMGIAKVAALRSNCMKRKVAAVIVRDQRVISTGYNGTPRGIANCNEGGCPRCNHLGPSGADLEACLCSHAEENAIVQAAYHGVSVAGATLYTTFSPCLSCTKMIINSGIREVVFNKTYTIAELPLRLLQEASVKARKMEAT